MNKLRNGKDTARRQTLTRDICMRSAFFTGDIYDASSTIFADDITKRTVTNTQEVITKMGETSTMLKKFAADIGIVMNQSKEEHQVGFVGPGSVTSMRMLHREGKWPDSMDKLCPTVEAFYSTCVPAALHGAGEWAYTQSMFQALRIWELGKLRRVLCLRRRPNEGWVDYMKRTGVIAARQLKKHGQQRVANPGHETCPYCCLANGELPERHQRTETLGRIGDMAL